MTRRTFIGIDPGKGGAIAWSDREGVFTVSMPDTRAGIIEALQFILSTAIGVVPIYIERVAPFIPGGGASAMFEFGVQVERIGCLVECIARFGGSNVQVHYITPQSWQKKLKLGKSTRVKVPRAGKLPKLNGADKVTKRLGKILQKQEDDSFNQSNAVAIKEAKSHNDRAKREWKKSLKTEAEVRFPGASVTYENADALLILEAGILIEDEKLAL